LIRAPLWFIGLLVIVAIGVGVYAYLTTPLPFGLGSTFRTPGGGAAQSPVAEATPSAGGPLALGSASLTVVAVQRNQDLTTEGRGGPPGNFTVVELQLVNSGAEPLSAQPASFRLVDDQGRTYSVDAEATRTENVFGHRRNVFEASVPPGGAMSTYLVFQTTPTANVGRLRVQLGYGEVSLPR
jgi:hypothetical protein